MGGLWGTPYLMTAYGLDKTYAASLVSLLFLGWAFSAPLSGWLSDRIQKRKALLITGSSRQSPDWMAEHGDGWITYPRAVPHQARAVADYRRATNALGHGDKPVMQSLYVDLASEPSEPPSPIHLGFRSGATALTDYLTAIEDAGVNHVALNLRFNQANIEDTLQRLADALLPRFLTGDT